MDKVFFISFSTENKRVLSIFDTVENPVFSVDKSVGKFIKKVGKWTSIFRGFSTGA